jgi:hypothetical protein
MSVFVPTTEPLPPVPEPVEAPEPVGVASPELLPPVAIPD